MNIDTNTAYLIFCAIVIIAQSGYLYTRERTPKNKKITLRDDEFRLKETKDLIGGIFSIFDRAESKRDEKTTFYCQQKIVVGNEIFNRTVILEASNEKSLKAGKFTIFESTNDWRMMDNKFPGFEYGKKIQ